jgi:hemerythrin-like domain-containing protein
MASITQPLRDEHKELLPYVEIIRQAGDAVNESLTTMAHERIEEVYRFLTQQLIPHAHAEEQALYPMVQKAMDAEQATATMSRDHTEINLLTEELDKLRVDRTQLSITSIQTKSLRRVLYGLYGLVKLHFVKEEEIYLPLLDAKLTPEEANSMFEQMEAVANKAKQKFSQ